MATANALDSDSMFQGIILRGAKLKTDISQAITSASIDMSTDEVSQLTVNIEDPYFKILGSGTMALNTAVDYQDLKFQISAIAADGGSAGLGGTSIELRPVAVQKLKNRKGPMVLKKISPSEFVQHECAAVGVRAYVEPSAKRIQIARDVLKSGEAAGNEAPSSWTTFKRLAQEVGYVLFEQAGVICFGRPSFFVKWAAISPDPNWNVDAFWNTGAEKFRLVKAPSCRMSVDSTDGVSVTVQLPIERSFYARPGRVLRLRGVPLFTGNYFITRVSYDLAGLGDVTVEAKTPQDPEPQPPEATVNSSGSGSSKTATSSTDNGLSGTTGRRGEKSAYDFVYWALKQQGDTYRFGAEARKSDKDPDVFDCSELVEWAAAQAGCYMPDGSANQRSYCRSKGTVARRHLRRRMPLHGPYRGSRRRQSRWLAGRSRTPWSGGRRRVRARRPPGRGW
jgi:hypothetical protein